MDYFTQEDHDWFKKVQELPEIYMIVIDNDSIWVDEKVDDDAICAYTFNSYGYEFIHALLKDMGINCEFC
jgi:hypothetical protein